MSKKEDSRVQRTRETFQKTLIKLIEEKSYHSITVQEIAEVSALNRATFYLHYYDKDDLLKQMLIASLKHLQTNVKIYNSEFHYGTHLFSSLSGDGHLVAEKRHAVYTGIYGNQVDGHVYCWPI